MRLAKWFASSYGTHIHKKPSDTRPNGSRPGLRSVKRASDEARFLLPTRATPPSQRSLTSQSGSSIGLSAVSLRALPRNFKDRHLS